MARQIAALVGGHKDRAATTAPERPTTTVSRPTTTAPECPTTTVSRPTTTAGRYPDPHDRRDVPTSRSAHEQEHSK